MAQKSHLILAGAAFAIILIAGIVSINIGFDWHIFINTMRTMDCIYVEGGDCTSSTCISNPYLCETDAITFYWDTLTSKYPEVILFIVLVIIGCIIYKILSTRKYIFKDKLS